VLFFVFVFFFRFTRGKVSAGKTRECTSVRFFSAVARVGFVLCLFFARVVVVMVVIVQSQFFFCLVFRREV